MMEKFRLAEWISEVDNDDDGTCHYACDGWCDGVGDTFDTVVHTETCPIGEIQRQERDADDFLGSLAARDQEVAVLCATAKKVISLIRHRGDRELVAALKNLQVAIDMAQNEIVVERGA